MRIEAVTVCLHYDDFLEQTIRVNQSLFDDWVVVTSQADAGTIAVCQHTAYARRSARTSSTAASNSQEASGDQHRPGSPQARRLGPPPGRRYRAARDAASTWRTWSWTLPVFTGSTGSTARLSPPGKTGWSTPTPTRSITFITVRNGRSVPGSATSTTAAMPRSGFFSSGTGHGVLRYPSVEGWDAEHTDMLHALQWPRSKRVLIPEITAVHLSTGGKDWGLNWHGRTRPGSRLRKRSASAIAHERPRIFPGWIQAPGR